MINGLIGLSMGLLVGGAIVSVAGVVSTVLVGNYAIIPLFGFTGPQTAAIGILALDFVAMFVLPALGITTTEPIEFAQ